MSKKTRGRNHDGLITTDGSYQGKASDVRVSIQRFYLEKFFNKFLNKFEFTGLSYQQVAFIMRQFWSVGTIGCFIRKDWNLIKDSDQIDEYDQIVFAPWVWNDKLNIYNFPTKVMFINLRAVSFIPTTPFELDKTAVIGYIMRNRKGVYSLIESKLNQLVDIEMTIRTSLKTQKMPYFIACSPEDEKKMKVIIDRLMDDEDVLYGAFDDLKNVKTLVSGAPYVLDKLYMLKQAVENEILTLLGINNIGILQKKEHLTTGEVEENDEMIQNSSDEFLSSLEEFFERVYDVLGYRINVKLKEELLLPEEKDNNIEEENKDD